MIFAFLVWPMKILRYILGLIGLFAVTCSICTLPSVGAQAQTSEPSVKPHQSTLAQPNIGTLSEEQKEAFRVKMMAKPITHSGCFEARPPSKEWKEVQWKEVQCGPAPKAPNPLTLRSLAVTNVGYGNDYFVAANNISSVTGSFDSASGITSIYSPIFQQPKTVVYSNSYTLQINANKFNASSITGCAGGSCVGWQQFLLSQRSNCGSACVYIEYWLFDSPSCPSDGALGKGCTCPSSAAWISYYDPSAKTASGCFFNTQSTPLPTPLVTDLDKLHFSGVANAGGMDQVTVQTADGLLHSKTSPDSTLNLANNWNGAEFNLFGDCCAYEAFLNSQSQLTVRLSTASATAPGCVPPNASFKGTTAETNNLQLSLGSCHTGTGSAPAIVFSESGGGPLPKGYTIGDTHLTTVFGVHYDFQGSGDFVLVQADPGLLVQARQKAVPGNPAVSVNTAVGIKSQDNHVAICLAGLSINGSFKTLADGESLLLANEVTVSRTGSVYVVSSPSGAVIRADLSPRSSMNVSVELGVTNATNVRGLLGGGRGEGGKEQNDPINGYGKPLRSPFSYTELSRYADSWRVRPADSLIVCDQDIEPGWPESPIDAGKLPPGERDRARSVCKQAGVKNGSLLDDCTLDVSLLGTDTAANAYVKAPVHAPDPTRILRPR